MPNPNWGLLHRSHDGELTFLLLVALLYDPVIGSYVLDGMTIPSYDFVKANNLILNLNQTFLDHLEKVNDQCGWIQVSRLVLRPPSAIFACSLPLVLLIVHTLATSGQRNTLLSHHPATTLRSQDLNQT